MAIGHLTLVPRQNMIEQGFDPSLCRLAGLLSGTGFLQANFSNICFMTLSFQLRTYHSCLAMDALPTCGSST